MVWNHVRIVSVGVWVGGRPVRTAGGLQLFGRGACFYFACSSSHGMLRSSMAPLAQKIEQAAGMAEAVVPLSNYVRLECFLLLTYHSASGAVCGGALN